MIGSSVGPYQLLDELGAGGMGTVYLGQNEAGEKVAVKIVQPAGVCPIQRKLQVVSKVEP